jgi:hypothetical protein
LVCSCAPPLDAVQIRKREIYSISYNTHLLPTVILLSNYRKLTSQQNFSVHQHRVAQNCTSVSLLCPVEDTIYGYTRSLPFNALFVAIFSLCALFQFILGIRAKACFFCYVLVLGCTGEAIGYAGRIIIHSNPVRYFSLLNSNQF